MGKRSRGKRRGSRRTDASSRTKARAESSASLPYDGPQGQPEMSGRPLVTGPVYYGFEPAYPRDDPRYRAVTTTPGVPGLYRVAFVLAVPGRDVVQEQVDFNVPDAAGDSLLLAPPNAAQLGIDIEEEGGETFVLLVHLNKHHRVRSVSLEIQAANFREAGELGHDLIMPVLSRWSFVHDVAITTSAVHIQELATGAQSIELTLLGAVKGFSDVQGFSAPDHRVLLAAYREGISSGEPLWQALSLYKVAEGVWAFRARRRAAAHATGDRINEPSERVPDDVQSIEHPAERGALVGALAPYSGKKFRAVFDEIRGPLRNSIAHILPDSGDPLAPDKWEDIHRVLKVLPGLRWMSRRLLQAELASLDTEPPDG
jgi:hypothetical protein